MRDERREKREGRREQREEMREKRERERERERVSGFVLLLVLMAGRRSSPILPLTSAILGSSAPSS